MKYVTSLLAVLFVVSMAVAAEADDDRYWVKKSGGTYQSSDYNRPRGCGTPAPRERSSNEWRANREGYARAITTGAREGFRAAARQFGYRGR